MNYKSIKVYETTESFLDDIKLSAYNVAYYEAAKEQPVAKTIKAEDLTVPYALICSFCKMLFDDRAEQMSHYNGAWHRFNLKLQMHNSKSVTEAEYESIVNDKCQQLSKTKDEIEPDELLSDSESEDGQNPDDSVNNNRLNGRVLFENRAGNILLFYQCMLFNKKNEPTYDNELVQKVYECCNSDRIMIVLLGGGHFASAIYKGSETVVCKTLHYYTVRAKQGGTQSGRDSRGNGSGCKSAGANLRRLNEKLLEKHVQDLFAKWKQEIANVQVIYYRSSGPINNSILFGDKAGQISKNDARLRKISISTHRATLRELNRIARMLSTVDYYVSKQDLEDDLKQNQQRNKSEESTVTATATVPGAPERKLRSAKCGSRGGIINRSKSREIKDRSIVGLNESFRSLSMSSSGTDYIENSGDSCASDTADGADIEENADLFPNKNNRFDAIKIAQDDETTTSASESVMSSRVPSPLVHCTTKKTPEKNASVQALNASGENKTYLELKTRFINGCKTGSVEKMKSYLQRARAEITSGQSGARESDIVKVLSEPVMKNGDTLLHMTSSEGHAPLVKWLMENNANPCLRNRQNLTAYSMAFDKQTKAVFRDFACKNPDKFDYARAQIPVSDLTFDELVQKRKEQKKLKKSLEKERKLAKQKEDAEIEKFQALSDREKRALAAEGRMAANKLIKLRCFWCGTDLNGIKFFEYSDNIFCSTKCLQENRRKFGLQLSF